jgi:hypothetical protein
MKLLSFLAALVMLGGCAPLQQFTEGDLRNASALAAGGHDPIGAMCWKGFEVAAAKTPQPADDGLAVLAERKRLVEEVVAGPCGAVIAPALLRDVGKLVPAPFGAALPF